jgi:hypothetical protein
MTDLIQKKIVESLVGVSCEPDLDCALPEGPRTSPAFVVGHATSLRGRARPNVARQRAAVCPERLHAAGVC